MHNFKNGHFAQGNAENRDNVIKQGFWILVKVVFCHYKLDWPVNNTLKIIEEHIFNCLTLLKGSLNKWQN